MDFGRVGLSGLDQVNFALPPDDPRTWIALKKVREAKSAKSVASNSPARIGIGAPVWGAKSWLGTVYPIGTHPRDFLYHYSQQFNSIELNTTHYRIPDESTIERWYDSTPSGFKFNVKFPQEISHRGLLSGHQAQVRQFVASVLDLEDRLGLGFLQLPPTFTLDDVSELKKFIQQLPSAFPLAVEVRHESFFSDHRLHAQLYDLLAQTEKHVVITDVSGRRDVLHTSLPSSKVMVRFIGNALHPTDEARISEWVARLHTWLTLGLDQVEFFIHQPEDRGAPELIARFIDHLNTECGFSLSKWKPMDQGQQLTLL